MWNCFWLRRMETTNDDKSQIQRQMGPTDNWQPRLQGERWDVLFLYFAKIEPKLVRLCVLCSFWNLRVLLFLLCVLKCYLIQISHLFNYSSSCELCVAVIPVYYSYRWCSWVQWQTQWEGATEQSLWVALLECQHFSNREKILTT